MICEAAVVASEILLYSVMVFILGASSLHRSLKKWSQVTNGQLFDKNIIAVPGLNLHPGSQEKLKVVLNRLGEIPVG